MMRCYLFVFLILISGAVNAQLENMRTLFFAATNDEGIKTFYTAATANSESVTTLKAYKGVATSMYAALANGINEKLDYFSKGKGLIEAAVTADWYNAEIRFLRFSVQCEAPFIVGYSDKKKEDVQIIMNALFDAAIDYKTTFWQQAINYMLGTKELSDEQQTVLKKYKL